MTVITIERQAAAIERWKVSNGITGRDYVPVNNGMCRTESKQALLATIAADAERLGIEPPFTANYNAEKWARFVETRNPAYLPDPASVARDNQQRHVRNIWRRLGF
jgi:hypothetical protein